MNPALSMPEEGMTLDELSNFVAEQLKRLNLVLKNLDGLNIVDIKFELQGGAYIQLNRKGFEIFDGTGKTFVVGIDGKATLSGVKVQTKNGEFPNVILDPEGNLFKASKSDTEFISIDPDATGSPTMFFTTPNSAAYISPTNITGVLTLLATIGNISINAQSGYLQLGCQTDLKLAPDGDLLIDNQAGYTGTIITGTGGDTIHVHKGIIVDVT